MLRAGLALARRSDRPGQSPYRRHAGEANRHVSAARSHGAGETVLYLQRQAGNGAVSGLISAGLTSLAALEDLAEQLVVKAIAGGAVTNENEITDDVFWIENPTLRDEKLKPGSPEALRWLHIRDRVVRPLLRPRPADPASPPPAAPPGMTPVDQVAAQSSAGGATDKGASAADKYFVQDVGNYRDTDDKSQTTRIWAYGSSGANVCNMTSLTMGLVSVAGESEVRDKMIELLRAKGMHGGASVQVGGKFVPLETALDDPKIAGQIALIDLVTAAAIGEHGGYKDVTVPGTIARVARESGLAAGSETVRGQPELTSAKGLALAKSLLASGKRVIAGTVNHYIYLIEVRSDGIVAHDPAGARVEPTLTGPLFLHTGSANSMVREWASFNAIRRERAVRRVSTNSEVAAIVNRLAEIPDGDRAALAALVKEHPGRFFTGRQNFYATSEFAENHLRLMVSLSRS